jgi:hypothetical protein
MASQGRDPTLTTSVAAVGASCRCESKLAATGGPRREEWAGSMLNMMKLQETMLVADILKARALHRVDTCAGLGSVERRSAP